MVYRCQPNCVCGRHSKKHRSSRRIVCNKGHKLKGEGHQRNCVECRKVYQRNYRTKKRRKSGKPLLRYRDTGICKKGHRMTPENTRVRRVPDRSSEERIDCVLCCRARHNQYRAKKLKAFVEYVDPLILYRRDKGICGICCFPVHVNQFDVDHIRPLSKGGGHSYRNTQVAHPSCNSRKKNRYSIKLRIVKTH